MLDSEIIKLIRNRDIKTVEDLVNNLKNEYDYSKNSSMEIVRNLNKKGIINLKTLEKKRKPNIYSFLKHYSSFDLYFSILTILIVYLCIYLINSNFTQALFGLFFLFFIPGYNFINIIFPNESKFRKYTKIAYGVIFSILISSITLYLVNLSFLKIDTNLSFISLLILNLILLIGAFFRRYNYFEKNLKYYSEKNFWNNRNKLIILSLSLIIILALLIRIYLNYFFPYYGIGIPYFNWASDHWIHYAIVRDSISYSYYSFSYEVLYSFYYPTLYMSLIGGFYITGINLISLFRWFPIFLGVFIVFSLICLAKIISKKWTIASLVGLLSCIMAPIFLSTTSVTWPQIIGTYLIILLVMTFYKINIKYSIKTVLIFELIYIFLIISHVVSMIVGSAIIMVSFILLSFKKGFNRKIFTSLIPPLIFLVIWTLFFYSNVLGFTINTTFDIIKYAGFGIIGFLGLIFLLYYFSKQINKEKESNKLEIGTIGKILIIIVMIILFNPLFWFYFPLTKDIVTLIPFELFYSMLIAMILPIFIAIFGIFMKFNINKKENILLLGWLLGILFITAFFLILGKFTYPSRCATFILEPVVIYSAYFFFKLFKSKKLKRNLIIFLVLVSGSTPLSILAVQSTTLGSGSINFRSEVNMISWCNNNSDWNDNILFIADTRMDFLLKGQCWNRERDLNITNNIDYILLENYDSLINFTNTNFNNSQIIFFTNYYVYENGYYYLQGNEIARLIINEEIENEWTNSINYSISKIYSNQLSNTYIINT